MKYRVRFYQDNSYEVTEEIEDDDVGGYDRSVFQGSLSDCEWRDSEKVYIKPIALT